MFSSWMGPWIFDEPAFTGGVDTAWGLLLADPGWTAGEGPAPLVLQAESVSSARRPKEEGA